MLLVLLCSVPAILMVWPLVDSLVCTMGLAPESGAAMAVLAAFGLGALALPFEFVVERRRWWPAGAALIAALSFLSVAVSETRYSDLHPKPVNVYYVLDADRSAASWAVRVERPDAWLTQFLGDDMRLREGQFGLSRRARPESDQPASGAVRGGASRMLGSATPSPDAPTNMSRSSKTSVKRFRAV